MYVCNQRNDCIALFHVDGATGRLTFSGQYTGVGTPAFITFLLRDGGPSYLRALRRKQVGLWSLTMPEACMKA